MTKLIIDVEKVLERYNALTHACPTCGKTMAILDEEYSDSEPYLYCFDCKRKESWPPKKEAV